MSGTQPSDSEKMLETEAKQIIDSHVRPGFRSIDDAKVVAIEVLSDHSDPELVRRVVERVAPDCALAIWKDSLDWPNVTDCDRLDAAFEELNSTGIMARHNWACCGTCGRAEIPDEFARIGGVWDGVPVIGYVFYHEQDSESAAAGSSLYFNYGSCEESPDEATYFQRSTAIATRACEIIAKHGLEVEWDGSIRTRPRIAMTWQRRQPPARFVGD